VADPDGVDGPPGTTPGLGLLQVDTVMAGDKCLSRVQGVHLGSGQPLQGYEMHMGRTCGEDQARPFATLAGGPEGAVSADGRVAGTYLHGMFATDAFRAAWLGGFGVARSDIGSRRRSRPRWMRWPTIWRKRWM